MNSDEMRQRLAVLRAEAMQLLGACAADQDAPCGADLIVALQDAANLLGAAQAALSPPAPLALAPAPIEPSRRDEVRDTESPTAPPTTPFDAEAVIVLTLAEITVPLAHTPQDEAERWLRVLRQEGRVGAALHALGIDEPQLATPADSGPRADRSHGLAAVRVVREHAADLARQRDGACATTLDVLFAVMLVYGRGFDRSLYAAGASRAELLDQLSGRATVVPSR